MPVDPPVAIEFSASVPIADLTGVVAPLPADPPIDAGDPAVEPPWPEVSAPSCFVPRPEAGPGDIDAAPAPVPGPLGPVPPAPVPGVEDRSLPRDLVLRPCALPPRGAEVVFTDAAPVGVTAGAAGRASEPRPAEVGDPMAPVDPDTLPDVPAGELEPDPVRPMSLDAAGPSLGIFGRAMPGSFEPGAADSSGFLGLSVAMKSSFPAQGLVVAMTGEWPVNRGSS